MEDACKGVLPRVGSGNKIWVQLGPIRISLKCFDGLQTGSECR